MPEDPEGAWEGPPAEDAGMDVDQLSADAIAASFDTGGSWKPTDNQKANVSSASAEVHQGDQEHARAAKRHRSVVGESHVDDVDVGGDSEMAAADLSMYQQDRPSHDSEATSWQFEASSVTFGVEVSPACVRSVPETPSGCDVRSGLCPTPPLPCKGMESASDVPPDAVPQECLVVKPRTSPEAAAVDLYTSLCQAGFEPSKIAAWHPDRASEHDEMLSEDSPRDVAMRIVTTLYDPMQESELAGVDQFVALGFTDLASTRLTRIHEIFEEVGSRSCLDIATDYISVHFARYVRRRCLPWCGHRVHSHSRLTFSITHTTLHTPICALSCAPPLTLPHTLISRDTLHFPHTFFLARSHPPSLSYSTVYCTSHCVLHHSLAHLTLSHIPSHNPISQPPPASTPARHTSTTSQWKCLTNKTPSSTRVYTCTGFIVRSRRAWYRRIWRRAIRANLPLSSMPRWHH
jgi:hypothetical protein